MMTVKRILKKMIVFLYKIMAHILPVSRKTVVFMSNMGKNFSGNPRALYKAMQEDERFADYRLVWAFTRAYLAGNGDTPARGYVVYGGFKYYYYMAIAGIWVFDTRQEPYLVKRSKNIYLQTWHGTPLKKLGLDLDEVNMAGEKEAAAQERVEAYKKAFIDEAAKWDYLLAQNDFSAEIFSRCFGYDGQIIKTGYPRNDELVLRTGAETAAGADYGRAETDGGAGADYGRAEADGGAGADDSRRTLLYAPTWRDDMYLEGGWYKYSSLLDFRRLEEELGAEFRIIVKLHYLVKLQPGDIPQECIDSGFVSIIGNECDIADLYLQADGLITDYSSVMFDYSLTGRPMFFYCYDLEAYRDRLRGFYFDFLEEAPGPVSNTVEQLTADIRETYSDKYSAPVAEHVVADSVPAAEHVVADSAPTAEHVVADGAPAAERVVADSAPVAEHAVSAGGLAADFDPSKIRKTIINKTISMKYQNFVAKYNMYDDGHAAQKVLEALQLR